MRTSVAAVSEDTELWNTMPKKSIAANITGVNIQFIPGEDLKNIFADMGFTPVPTRAAARAVLKTQKAGETMVDILGKDTSGGGNSGGSGEEEENPLG